MILAEELVRKIPVVQAKPMMAKAEKESGLTFTLENLLCIWRDGELVGVERQNGKIERWSTEAMRRGQSLELFGVDKPAKL